MVHRVHDHPRALCVLSRGVFNVPRDLLEGIEVARGVREHR